ncbi:hypothetical protein V7128_07310 [Neobacillus vireti]|uniref:hypothetical protein n=1 Tax=Neobacillus vireti TaxID=220686 RepID=UPI002FFFCAB1
MSNVGELTARVSLGGLDEISSQLRQLGASMQDTSRSVSEIGNSLRESTSSINNFGRAFGNQAQSLEQIESQIEHMTQRIQDFESATSSADSETSHAYVEANNRLRALRQEYSLLVSATRQFGSETARRMVDAMRPMQALQAKAREIQGQWMHMGLNTAQFNGDANAMMSAIEELGKKQKQVQEEMMKANQMGRIAIMQQAGAMMNLSSQASKISSAFKEAGGVMNAMSQPALRVADGLNRMANRGNAAVIALRQLGPNANMKQLQDRINMINQGLMRANAVALTGGLLSAIVYGSLFNAAMETDKEFAGMVKTLKQVWSEALQPMVQAFADVGKAIMPVLIAVGKMVVSFNQAHPVLAKLIQGFLMLVPALILILSPLAVGIGMFAGLQAMFAQTWMLIGPLVTGLSAISGSVLAIGAAIVGLIAVGVLLYKNWDTVLKWLSTAWNWIKGVAISVFNSIVAFFKQWGLTILAVITGPIGMLALLIYKNWDAIKAYASVAWNAIVNTIKSVWAGISGFFSALWSGIVSVFSAIWSKLVAVATTVFNAIKSVVQVAWNVIKTIFLVAIGILVTLLAPLWNAFATGWNAMVSVVSAVMAKVKSWVSSAITFLIGLWNNFKAMVSAVWNAIYSSVISPVINKIKAMVQTLIAKAQSVMNTVKSAFSSAWNAISSVVSSVISRIKSIIQTITAFVQGVVSRVKSAFSSAFNAVASVVSSVISRIKSVVNTIASTASSVGSRIRSAFSSAWNGVSSVVSSAISSIKSKISSIWSTASSIASRIKSAFSNLFSGIKVPHFSMGGWSPKDLPKLPKISVSWHAKGGILDSATLIGAGEKGAEAIVPLSSQRRMKPFAQAVSRFMPESSKGASQTIINVAQLHVREEADLQKVAQELNRLQERKERARGGLSFNG